MYTSLKKRTSLLVTFPGGVVTNWRLLEPPPPLPRVIVPVYDPWKRPVPLTTTVTDCPSKDAEVNPGYTCENVAFKGDADAT